MNKNQIILSFISLLILLLSGFFFWHGLKNDLSDLNLNNLDSEKIASPSAQILGDQIGEDLEKNKFDVTKVIDGDTIEVDYFGEKRSVRFIGINTPETVDPRRSVECFGKEASLENKRLLERKEVILEKDISETDKYNRLLRYVYIKLDDGNILFVNDYLVRQGFANSLSYPPDIKYQERFLEAEKDARENLRGLWGRCK